KHLFTFGLFGPQYFRMIFHSVILSRGCMKSEELQGLRGVAVIAVVLFHLKVEYVSRGFLGVDVFFVLSGYFMAKALFKKTVDFKSALNFYERRVKRLLPAYALLLFLITLAIPWFFILNEVDATLREIYFSMSFTTNFMFAVDPQDYFTKDKDLSSIVMHLWSLAVEMQFYFVAPLIFYAVNRLDRHDHRLVAHCFVIAVSLALHIFESSKSRQFYLLHCRLWEFVVGFVVQEFEQKTIQHKADDKMTNNWTQYKRIMSSLSVASSVILFWMLCGTKHPESDTDYFAYRICTILCTSLIILASSIAVNKLLSMRFLVYIGDISYILYLLHWPVIVLYHVHSFTLGSTGIVACLSISLTLSVLVHHTFEKPLLTRTFSHCFVISMAFYMITLFAISSRLPQNLSDQILRNRQGGNTTLYDLMKWNYDESIACCNSNPTECVRDLDTELWTGQRHQLANSCVMSGNGKHSVLVIGNSVSMSSFSTVHKVLNGRYSKLRFFAKQGCWMLVATCEEFWHWVTQVVDKMKPDIILITESQRLMNDRPEDDRVMEVAQQRIDYMRTHSRAVMVDTQYLIPDFPHSYALAHFLARGWTNMSISSMSLVRQLSLKRVSYDRITLLRGNNLVINNITFGFCERVEGICEGYNPNTLKAYTQTGAHINSYGYELLEPMYRQSIDKVFDIVSRN
ncbi:hypothetical protein PENTCL1PPCAC_29818, partial [Pristionchus entomophagus]